MPLNIEAFRAKQQILIKFICLILFIAAANVAAGWVVDVLNLEIRPNTEDMVHRLIMISAIAYVVLIAIPFVPGVEIGLTLIGLLGPAIVFLVYVCTLTGLLSSFAIGRFVPMSSLIELLHDLHLHRSRNLLETIEPMDMQERLSYLTSRTPNRLLNLLLQHRYLALAVVLNLPGNLIIGGGGGIALMAGVSRLYSIRGFVVTVAFAIAPLPVAIFIFGTELFSI